MHVNCVAIGHFNPGILRPEFLKEKCQIDVSERQLVQTKYSSFVSEVKYDGIQFLVLPDRLQITDSKVEEIEKSSVHEYSSKYLGCLEYTPIAACGFNFLFGDIGDPPEILEGVNRASLQKSLNTQSLRCNVHSILEKGNEKPLSFQLEWEEPSGIARLQWNTANSQVNVNFETRFTELPINPETKLSQYGGSKDLMTFLQSYQSMCKRCREVLSLQLGS